MKGVQANVIDVGMQDYQITYQSMLDFTNQRSAQTIDQIWVLQHTPVYTIGSNHANVQRPETSIPVIDSDRGGQMTYHGPGQLILYFLFDLQRRKLGIRKLVESLELAMIDLLGQYAIEGSTWKGFPGVYVGESKIASVGLRVRNGCCYHGISLNVNMDLRPFEDIVVCGQKDLTVTQVSDLGGPDKPEQLALPLVHIISHRLKLNLTD